MGYITHPHYKLTGGCDECRKWVFSKDTNGKVERVPRGAHQATDEFLQCHKCEIRGLRDFEWIGRNAQLIYDYMDCQNGFGRSFPRANLDENPLHIRFGFRLLDNLFREE